MLLYTHIDRCRFAECCPKLFVVYIVFINIFIEIAWKMVQTYAAQNPYQTYVHFLTDECVNVCAISSVRERETNAKWSLRIVGELMRTGSHSSMFAH